MIDYHDFMEIRGGGDGDDDDDAGDGGMLLLCNPVDNWCEWSSK